MESSYLRETLSFLRDPCVRREGIQRYAARLKSGYPLPAPCFRGDKFRGDKFRGDKFREDDIYTRILILLKIYVELRL